MALDKKVLAIAEEYTEETIKGEGAIKGKDGDSAYQVAVKNGFSGTESEWLESLKGKDGTTSIDDSKIAEDSTYSSKKVEEDLAKKVDKEKINTITGETDPTIPSLEFMKVNTYSLGIPELDLAEGQDLDELTTRNRKYKTTGAVAATLLHCPVTTTGFRLTVYSMSVTSYVTQIIETADERYVRYWNKSKNKWYDWKKVATDDDLANYVPIQQDVADKGKALVVGDDGKVIPTEISTDDALSNTEIKMLGWTVPKECSIQNEVNGNTFTQRVGRVDLGALNWGINAYATPTAFSLHENIDLPDLVSVSDNKDEKIRCYSPNYDCDSASKVTGTSRTYTFCVITGKRLYVRADVTTVDELKAELKGKYIYYELETPITKQIDGNEVIEKDAVTAKVNNFVKPTSNAEILALSNGIYSINVDDTSLFPCRWGTLIVLKSGYVYGSMLFIGTDAKAYIRNISSGAWRETSWTALN